MSEPVSILKVVSLSVSLDDIPTEALIKALARRAFMGDSMAKSAVKHRKNSGIARPSRGRGLAMPAEGSTQRTILELIADRKARTAREIADDAGLDLGATHTALSGLRVRGFVHSEKRPRRMMLWRLREERIEFARDHEVTQ